MSQIQLTTEMALKQDNTSFNYDDFEQTLFNNPRKLTLEDHHSDSSPALLDKFRNVYHDKFFDKGSLTPYSNKSPP